MFGEGDDYASEQIQFSINAGNIVRNCLHIIDSSDRTCCQLQLTTPPILTLLSRLTVVSRAAK